MDYQANWAVILFSRQIKDVNRQIKKAVVASNLDELQRKSSEKFGKSELPQIHLDSDGTEIDDEDYFQTLEPNTDLIAVFSGERWIDVSLNANWMSIYILKGAENCGREIGINIDSVDSLIKQEPWSFSFSEKWTK